MAERELSECPFCGFKPDAPKDDVKTAPELEAPRVYRYAEKKHPDWTNELPSYTKDP